VTLVYRFVTLVYKFVTLVYRFVTLVYKFVTKKTFSLKNSHTSLLKLD